MHGWLELARPRVFVLTDGSGRAGVGRLDSTRRLIERAGARPGGIFGRLSDRAIYTALLERDVASFARLADELASALAEVDYVVGDAAERYNPAHDVCRILIDAAVARERGRGRPLPSFQFPLVGSPVSAAGPGAGALEIHLSDGALDRKLAAARAYVALADEVASALDRAEPGAFRREVLDPVGPAPAPSTCADPPFYERHGERRVAEGHYGRVLRRREHVLPIAEALRVEGGW